MAFKNIKGSTRNSLLDYAVSGKAVQYHSAEKGFRVPPQGLTATGGVISDYTDGPTVYRAHIFTSSGTFDVSAIGDYGDTVEYLVVGGGGGGGGDQIGAGAPVGRGMGGGGAGGYRSSVSGENSGGGASAEPSFSVSVQSYPIIVGAGGAGGQYGPGDDTGRVGGQSTFSTITSNGGGGGGGSGDNGGPGGSGGGGGWTATSGGPRTENQGYVGGGGNSSGNDGAGGGGGGAGGAGNNATTPYGGASSGGPGGLGLSSNIAGPTNDGIGAPGPSSGRWFAGGGGGGRGGTGGGPGGPYAGGGNANVSSPPAISANGTFSTGGGGGGTGGQTSAGQLQSGNGGSGIVVVRYQIGQLTATAKATGGAVSFSGGKTIHIFTNSGTFTAPSPLNPTPLAIDYLVVGGGGGGAGGRFDSADGHGAGGAGGLRTNHPDCPAPLRSAAYSVTAGQDYTVTIGAGGPGGFNGDSASYSNRGTPGSDSNFYPTPVSFPSTAYIRGSGGGGGGSYQLSSAANRDGQDGGSGGGGAGGGPGAGTGGTGNLPADPNWPIAQGNPGGNTGPNFGSGGGGGFTGAGSNADASNNPGPGGAGIDLSISGSSIGYAGGGGGGAAGPYRGSYSGGTATHGGGAGADADTTAPTYFGEDGTQNRGGGGGGGGANHPAAPIPDISAGDLQQIGGNGGSGIVIITYPS